MYLLMNLKEKSCDYIYIDSNNRVHFLMPIVAGTSVATDNTCQTMRALQRFWGFKHREASALDVLTDYKANLEHDIAYCDRIGQIQVANLKRERLKQIEAYIQLHQRLAQPAQRPHLNAEFAVYPEVIARMLNKAEVNLFSMLLSPQHEDDFTRAVRYHFTLKRGADGDERFARELQRRLTGGPYLTKPSLEQRFKDVCTQHYKSSDIVFPQSDATNKSIGLMTHLERIAEYFSIARGPSDLENPIFRLLFQQLGITLPLQQRDSERHNGLIHDWLMGISLGEALTYQDLIDYVLDYCKSSPLWTSCIPTKAPFNDYRAMAHFGEDVRETETFLIKVQFLFAEINLYCHSAVLFKKQDIDFGQVLERQVAGKRLMKTLIKKLQIAFNDTEGDIEKVIYEFVNENRRQFGLKRRLDDKDIRQISQRFSEDYLTVKTMPHFDEFTLLDRAKAGGVMVHRNRLSMHYLAYCREVGADAPAIISAHEHEFLHDQRVRLKKGGQNELPFINPVDVRIPLVLERPLGNSQLVQLLVKPVDGGQLWYENLDNQEWMLLVYHRDFEQDLPDSAEGIRYHLEQAAMAQGEGALERLRRKIDQAKHISHETRHNLALNDLSRFDSLTGYYIWTTYFPSLEEKMRTFLAEDSETLLAVTALHQKYHAKLESLNALKTAPVESPQAQASFVQKYIVQYLLETQASLRKAEFLQWLALFNTYPLRDKTTMVISLIKSTKEGLLAREPFITDEEIIELLLKSHHIEALLRLDEEGVIDNTDVASLSLSAVRAGDVSVVRHLIEKARFDFSAKESVSGFNVLLLAIRQRNIDMVRYLSSFGELSDTLMSQLAIHPSVNPLDYALSTSPISWDIVTVLIENCPNSIDVLNAFKCAMKAGQLEVINTIMSRQLAMPALTELEDGEILYFIYHSFDVNRLDEFLKIYPMKLSGCFRLEPHTWRFIDYLALNNEWIFIEQAIQRYPFADYFKADRYTLAMYAASSQKWALLDKLIDMGVALNFYFKETGESIALEVCRHGSVTLFAKVLEHLDADSCLSNLHHTTTDGRTLLDYCLDNIDTKREYLEAMILADLKGKEVMSQKDGDMLKVLEYALTPPLPLDWFEDLQKRCGENIYQKYLPHIIFHAFGDGVVSKAHSLCMMLQTHLERHYIVHLLQAAKTNLVLDYSLNDGAISFLVKNNKGDLIFNFSDIDVNFDCIELLADKIQVTEGRIDFCIALLQKAITIGSYKIVLALIQQDTQGLLFNACIEKGLNPLQSCLAHEQRDSFKLLMNTYAEHLMLRYEQQHKSVEIRLKQQDTVLLSAIETSPYFDELHDCLIPHIHPQHETNDQHLARLYHQTDAIYRPAISQAYPVIGFAHDLVSMTVSERKGFVEKYASELVKSYPDYSLVKALQMAAKLQGLKELDFQYILTGLIEAGLDINQVMIYKGEPCPIACYLLKTGLPFHVEIVLKHRQQSNDKSSLILALLDNTKLVDIDIYLKDTITTMVVDDLICFLKKNDEIFNRLQQISPTASWQLLKKIRHHKALKLTISDTNALTIQMGEAVLSIMDIHDNFDNIIETFMIGRQLQSPAEFCMFVRLLIHNDKSDELASLIDNHHQYVSLLAEDFDSQSLLSYCLKHQANACIVKLMMMADKLYLPKLKREFEIKPMYLSGLSGETVYSGSIKSIYRRSGNKDKQLWFQCHYEGRVSKTERWTCHGGSRCTNRRYESSDSDSEGYSRGNGYYECAGHYQEYTEKGWVTSELSMPIDTAIRLAVCYRVPRLIEVNTPSGKRTIIDYLLNDIDTNWHLLNMILQQDSAILNSYLTCANWLSLLDYINTHHQPLFDSMLAKASFSFADGSLGDGLMFQQLFKRHYALDHEHFIRVIRHSNVKPQLTLRMGASGGVLEISAGGFKSECVLGNMLAQQDLLSVLMDDPGVMMDELSMQSQNGLAGLLASKHLNKALYRKLFIYYSKACVEAIWAIDDIDFSQHFTWLLEESVDTYNGVLVAFIEQYCMTEKLECHQKAMLEMIDHIDIDICQSNLDKKIFVMPALLKRPDISIHIKECLLKKISEYAGDNIDFIYQTLNSILQSPLLNEHETLGLITHLVSLMGADKVTLLNDMYKQLLSDKAVSHSMISSLVQRGLLPTNNQLMVDLLKVFGKNNSLSQHAQYFKHFIYHADEPSFDSVPDKELERPGFIETYPKRITFKETKHHSYLGYISKLWSDDGDICFNLKYRRSNRWIKERYYYRMPQHRKYFDEATGDRLTILATNSVLVEYLISPAVGFDAFMLMLKNIPGLISISHDNLIAYLTSDDCPFTEGQKAEAFELMRSQLPHGHFKLCLLTDRVNDAPVTDATAMLMQDNLDKIMALNRSVLRYIFSAKNLSETLRKAILNQPLAHEVKIKYLLCLHDVLFKGNLDSMVVPMQVKQAILADYTSLACELGVLDLKSILRSLDINVSVVAVEYLEYNKKLTPIKNCITIMQGLQKSLKPKGAGLFSRSPQWKLVNKSLKKLTQLAKDGSLNITHLYDVLEQWLIDIYRSNDGDLIADFDANDDITNVLKYLVMLSSPYLSLEGLKQSARDAVAALGQTAAAKHCIVC